MMLVKSLFAINSLLFTYVASKLFSSTASGFIQMSIINQIIGPVTFLSYFILKTQMKLGKVANVVRKIFVAFPYFNLCDSIFKLLNMHDLIEACEKQGLVFDLCTKVEQCLNNELCCGL
jgi:hypothetical protein